jgi:hypothetical protein
MNVKQIVKWAVISCLGFLLISAFLCCSFRPYWNDKLPAECNMSMNMLKAYYGSKDKSAVMPATDFCYKKLHRLSCQGEVFGFDEKGNPNAVDYTDAAKYRNYSQCLAELK